MNVFQMNGKKQIKKIHKKVTKKNKNLPTSVTPAYL